MSQTDPTLPQNFQIPFVFGSNGQMVTIQQDSDQEIRQAVTNIVNTRRNTIMGSEQIGIDDPVFGPREINKSMIKAAIERGEPRAVANIDAIALDDFTEDVLISITGVSP